VGERLELGQRAEVAQEAPHLVAVAEREQRVGEVVEPGRRLDRALGDGRGRHVLS